MATPMATSMPHASVDHRLFSEPPELPFLGDRWLRPRVPHGYVVSAADVADHDRLGPFRVVTPEGQEQFLMIRMTAVET